MLRPYGYPLRVLIVLTESRYNGRGGSETRPYDYVVMFATFYSSAASGASMMPSSMSLASVGCPLTQPRSS